MRCKFRIFRYDPLKDRSPYYDDYTIYSEPNDKILDCLNKIRWEHDSTLTYRMSCAHGVCGSDALRINGEITLACQRLVKDYSEQDLLVEPLPFFNVIKDLVVDLDPFFKKYHQVRPYLINTSKPPQRERIQSEEDRKKVDDVVKCILCACCTSACPVNQSGEDYIGPAALVRAYRYIFDSRDQAKKERLQNLDCDEGVWGCKTYFKCTEVCPKRIKVTASINKIKTELKDKK